MPIELVPLHSGALQMPSVSVRPIRDGIAGAPLPVALASAGTTVLVYPLSHALFTAAAIPVS